MTIKTLLLCVFLYVCLVWVGAVYFYPENFREFGLRWTFIGIAVVLAWLLLVRLWSWIRLERAKSAARPKVPVTASPAVNLHEDDAVLIALLKEAAHSLAKSSGALPAQRSLSAFPAYLLVGPENSGKTSTFVNSGLEPVLLAGQAAGSSQTIHTRLGNIWLAKNAIFIELGGRTFSGDLTRWASLLRILQRQSTPSGWRRFFQQKETGLDLRGVVAFCEVKDFTLAASPQGKEILERGGRQWRERLATIAEVFGQALPVYVVATKADIAIPYFADYFARVRDPEISQIFGCSLPLAQQDSAAADRSAEAENKRLTQSFSPLLHRLADLRLVRLTHEPDAKRKPGIYEFPREVRRLRPTFVQFLVEAFRPSPLHPSPFLRGYYFTGAREDDSATGPAAVPSDQSSADASAFFPGDATHIFKTSDPAKVAAPVSRGLLRRRWVFVSELFRDIILRDHASQAAPVRQETRVDLERRVIFAVTSVACLLLAAAFLWAWVRNMALLNSLDSPSVASGISIHVKPPSRADLESLDQLRQRLVQLLDYDRNGPPLGLRWGLYAGSKLTAGAKDLYFRRFRELLLDDLNGSLAAGLNALPAAASSSDPYQPAADILRTHLIISSGACPVDAPFVSRTLEDVLAQSSAVITAEWRALADRQIEFYANELAAGNPLKLPENTEAVRNARNYLRGVEGIKPVYSALLADTQRTLSSVPPRLGDVAPNYGQVLRGRDEMNAVFTRDGMHAFLAAAKNVKNLHSGNSCITGSPGAFKNLGQTAETEQALKELYEQDYIEAWQNFVKGFANLGYSGSGDAARKLMILADHRSPLLGLFAITSKETSFSASAPPAIVQKTKNAMEGVKKIFDTVKGSSALADVVPDGRSTDRIARAFQPVQAVVPPTSETWITEKTKPYVDGLAELAGSLQQIATTRSDTADPAVFQAAQQNYDKALNAARQLSSTFDPTGVNGLDAKVQSLLMDPITSAKPYIPSDISDLPRKKLNGEARLACGAIAPVLGKFPFQPSPAEASVQDLARVFAPGSGEIWKFQAKSLADSTLKDGSQWKAKDGAKVAVQPNVIVFLNKAQTISDAFFPPGASQPKLSYTLRPKLADNLKSFFISLTVDGQTHEWRSSIQKQFIWPAPPGTEPGVRAYLKSDSISFPFASRGGLWGIFRMMRDAEPRLAGSKVVEWKYLRGGDGRREAIQPAPVRLEFVEFPNGADVFHPEFFEGLRCPPTAAAQ